MDRKTYTERVNARLPWVWARMCLIRPELEAHQMPRIIVDARIKNALAFYYNEEKIIRISWYWAQKDKKGVILSEVIAHEVAHHVDEVLHGIESTEINDGHGPNWQQIMLDYGLRPLTHYVIHE